MDEQLVVSKGKLKVFDLVVLMVEMKAVILDNMTVVMKAMK